MLSSDPDQKLACDGNDDRDHKEHRAIATKQERQRQRRDRSAARIEENGGCSRADPLSNLRGGEKREHLPRRHVESQRRHAVRQQRRQRGDLIEARVDAIPAHLSLDAGRHQKKTEARAFRGCPYRLSIPQSNRISAARSSISNGLCTIRFTRRELSSWWPVSSTPVTTITEVGRFS